MAYPPAQRDHTARLLALGASPIMAAKTAGIKTWLRRQKHINQRSNKRKREDRERKKVTAGMKREGPVMCAFEEPVDEVSVMGETFVAYAHCGNRADDLSLLPGQHPPRLFFQGGSVMLPPRARATISWKSRRLARMRGTVRQPPDSCARCGHCEDCHDFWLASGDEEAQGD